MRRNVSDTEAWTPFDHFFVNGARALSRVIGMRRLTRPFWDRWRAGDVGDDVLFAFLDDIASLDDWPDAAERMLARAEADLAAGRRAMDRDQEIAALRRLSYMANLGHWGILPANPVKRRLYARARDAYLEAETLAFGTCFRRIAIPWEGATLPGNLHLAVPQGPLVVLVHGIDGCKEEHLATELALLSAGLSVLSFDGPGQAEAFLLDGLLWTPDFGRVIRAAIDAAASEGACTERVGVMGMSIGALWAYEAAMEDGRIRALYDLGAPINTRMFTRIPFIIKTKLCQITGARTEAEIRDVLGRTAIDDAARLARVGAAVRIVHGTKDRVVPMADKLWLRDSLPQGAEFWRIEGGDHCCTAHIPAIRADMADFFRRTLC